MSNLPVCRRAAHVHQLISHLPILYGFSFEGVESVEFGMGCDQKKGLAFRMLSW